MRWLRVVSIAAVCITAGLSERIPVKRASARTVRAVNARYLWVQVLLDRAHFSPGEIDASKGNVTSAVLKKFQAERGLPATGELDDASINALRSGQEKTSSLVLYDVIYDDVRGPFMAIPKNLMLQSKLKASGYQDAFEALGEKFHCSPNLIRSLNPGAKELKPGQRVVIPNVHRDSPAKAASIAVSKAEKTVQALDASGKLIAVYPATIGSEHDPLPIGDWKVTKVFWNPVFYYNPALFWDARPSDAKATIPPGPNNPAGAVWIGLTKEHYGLHGTPEPGAIGHAESHGCIRMTNWDAIELGQMVDSGTPVVFKE